MGRSGWRRSSSPTGRRENGGKTASHRRFRRLRGRGGAPRAGEGCLSLSGTRRARRWESIKVRWQNEKFQERIKTFTGWTAQIIQHEIDHCEGIII